MYSGQWYLQWGMPVSIFCMTWSSSPPASSDEESLLDSPLPKMSVILLYDLPKILFIIYLQKCEMYDLIPWIDKYLAAKHIKNNVLIDTL